mgnify:FL=1
MKELIIGILIPFAGTTLGSAMVFLLKNKIKQSLENKLIAFAAGIMLAASIWSLLIPSINLSSNLNKLSFIPAASGFMIGILFLLFIDSIIPHLHLNSTKPEGLKSNSLKTTKMLLAVTIHNIPEGMAVGVLFAGVLANDSLITLSSAISLAMGIAIQNFPEGAIISMPLKGEGMSKLKSFILGMLSGIVEPIAALITILLINFVSPILPYILAFAAGAMVYVIVEELIPEASSGAHSNLTTIAFAVGFVLMMVLDVVFG